MTTRRPTSHKGKRPGSKRFRSSSDVSMKSSTVYAEFTIYDGASSPQWHPIKKMRYVFFRMIGGSTITDAIAEIHWHPAEFWHLVDLKRHGPFREEYKRAKILQGRALGDSVITIAEGRDRITRRAMRRLTKLLNKGFKKAGKQKSALAAKAMIERLLQQLDANDAKIIARNRLQIDAMKWLAKAVNPAEFGESSKLSLGMPPEDGDAPHRPIQIQFVGPDGKVVKP